MENTSQGENEVEKQEESVLETPPVQGPEGAEGDQKDSKADPLKNLQDELAEARDKYLRLYAEFDNYRRRTAREKLEMIQGANEQLIKALLAVVDDFERAEKASGEKNNKEGEGFLLIQNKLKKVMEQYGVKAMDTQGDFNPDLHESITHLPATDESLKGKILEVVEKGYLLNDKVIRFAKVIVGN